MKDFLILGSIVGIIAGFFILDRRVATPATVWSTDSCVTEKWHRWVTIRGVIPTDSEEALFREECWTDMGASLNGG